MTGLPLGNMEPIQLKLHNLLKKIKNLNFFEIIFKIPKSFLRQEEEKVGPQMFTLDKNLLLKLVNFKEMLIFGCW